MLYDCIIVGGGPAGSICSFILQKNGMNCLLLEMRKSIDEKTCGGFIPDRCRRLILDCGIDLTQMIPDGNQINGYYEMRNQQIKKFLYESGRFGVGVYRKNFDSYLLDRTAQAGTKIVCGENVRHCAWKDGVYHVNGYQGMYLIWAIGAKPPIQIDSFDRVMVQEKNDNQSIGISEIICVDDGTLDDNMVYFWYTEALYDYFWAIPIAPDTWNIGYWTNKDGKNLKNSFWSGRKQRIESSCSGIHTILPPRGAALGNIDYSDCLIDKQMFCCGDLAGTNNAFTGEGIAQAVRSAMNTANIIIQLAGRERT